MRMKPLMKPMKAPPIESKRPSMRSVAACLRNMAVSWLASMTAPKIIRERDDPRRLLVVDSDFDVCSEVLVEETGERDREDGADDRDYLSDHAGVERR